MFSEIKRFYNALEILNFTRYWHRSLNPKKLIEVKFSHLSRNMTMQRHLKLYRLPEETKVAGLRPLKAADVPEACKLLNKVRSYVNAESCPFVLYE